MRKQDGRMTLAGTTHSSIVQLHRITFSVLKHAHSSNSSAIFFTFNMARMSTDSLMGKSPGPRISAYSSMGRYLGQNMYVMFALLDMCQKHRVDFFSLIYNSGGAPYFFRLTTTACIFEIRTTIIQSYNETQIYDLGEWWDLRGKISTRRLGP